MVMDLDRLEGQTYGPTPGWHESKATHAWRQQGLVMLAIAAALLVLSGPLWWTAVTGADTFDPPRFNSMHPAGAADATLLEGVARSYRVAAMTAQRTGDTSAFSLFLINDPNLDTWQECDAVLATYAEEIAYRL